MSLINELMLYTRKLCFPIGRFVSMSSIYELKTKICLIKMQLMKLYKKRPELTSQFDVSKERHMQPVRCFRCLVFTVHTI